MQVGGGEDCLEGLASPQKKKCQEMHYTPVSPQPSDAEICILPLEQPADFFLHLIPLQKGLDDPAIPSATMELLGDDAGGQSSQLPLKGQAVDFGND